MSTFTVKAEDAPARAPGLPLSLKGLVSEHHNCIDCGYNTHPGVPTRTEAEWLLTVHGEYDVTFTADSEVYIVRDSVWKQTGLQGWGGCLCVGCLEKRIGRKLKSKDFAPDHPFNDQPCSKRLRQRRGDNDRLHYQPGRL